MEVIPLTYGRAFKVLWGFLWRSFVVMLPLMFLAPFSLLSLLPLAALSNPALLSDPFYLMNTLGRLMLAMFIMTVIGLLLQVVAMRWTLAARWSDFRLLLAPPDSQERR